MKRARKIRAAIVATLSNYHEAVIHDGGVTLVRKGSVPLFLNDDETDRLCEEWRRFRAEPAIERRAEPRPQVDP